MSRTFHHGERRIRVRAIRRDDPDLRKLARAFIELARVEAEAEAAADHQKRTKNVARLSAKKRKSVSAEDAA